MPADAPQVGREFLFKPVRDMYGNRLALAFGNEYENGQCPFYVAKQCYHCDIGAGEGMRFTPGMNRQRLAFFQGEYASVLPDLNHLSLYNSGSTLNQLEMSRETLASLLGYFASLEGCKVISFDSREPFVTHEALEFIGSHLRGDQQARITLGLESQSDEVRMVKLNKKMSRPAVEKAFEAVGRHGGNMGVDVNIVFQPPELVGEAAEREAMETVRYGLDLAERFGVPVDFNYHPFYPSKKSRAIYPNHPRADLDSAKRALAGIIAEIGRRGKKANLFIGWQDEEHDQEQNVRAAEMAREMERFARFNVTQDPSALNA